MSQTALAKIKIAPDQAPDAARLRAVIIQIIRSEYSGDVDSEFWLRPARRCADRIVEVIGR
jgi:hypothetical protein